ncbi:hypothetical protein FGB62_34g146 [Gracilaria domingensis]|nr:hypothetical protein FGB62_34g146 [Gracilaria domingensis]
MLKPATINGAKPPGLNAAVRNTKISRAKCHRAITYVAKASQKTMVSCPRCGAKKKPTRIAVDVRSHVAYMRANAGSAVDGTRLYRVLCGDSGLRYAPMLADSPATPVTKTHIGSGGLCGERTDIALAIDDVEQVAND